VVKSERGRERARRWSEIKSDRSGRKTKRTKNKEKTSCTAEDDSGNNEDEDEDGDEDKEEEEEDEAGDGDEKEWFGCTEYGVQVSEGRGRKIEIAQLPSANTIQGYGVVRREMGCYLLQVVPASLGGRLPLSALAAWDWKELRST
jgi:hypothetical protein